MSRFIETIAIKNREPLHLDWHQKRVNATFKAHFNSQPFQLSEVIKIAVEWPDHLSKWRLVYDQNPVLTHLEFYHERHVSSFALFETQHNYSFKFEDRGWIQKARNVPGTDDVIFTKNGFLCDAGYSNIIFKQGKHWYTPATYLLNGTTRQRLLHEGVIHERPIHRNDLKDFEGFKLINALLAIESSRFYSIEMLLGGS